MKSRIYLLLSFVCLTVISSANALQLPDKKQSVLGDTVDAADLFLNRFYNRCTDNCCTKLFFPTDGYAKITLDVFTGLIGAAILFKSMRVAYAHRETLAPHVTMNNLVNIFGCVYLANKLAPDWFKGFCRKVPLVKRIVFQQHLRETVVTALGTQSLASRSPSLACVEYAAIGGIAYGLRSHINASDITKVALACECMRLATPQSAKLLAVKIPIIRRLIV